jgi:hypothetical protein
VPPSLKGASCRIEIEHIEPPDARAVIGGLLRHIIRNYTDFLSISAEQHLIGDRQGLDRVLRRFLTPVEELNAKF